MQQATAAVQAARAVRAEHQKAADAALTALNTSIAAATTTCAIDPSALPVPPAAIGGAPATDEPPTSRPDAPTTPTSPPGTADQAPPSDSAAADDTGAPAPDTTHPEPPAPDTSEPTPDTTAPQPTPDGAAPVSFLTSGSDDHPTFDPAACLQSLQQIFAAHTRLTGLQTLVAADNQVLDQAVDALLAAAAQPVPTQPLPTQPGGVSVPGGVSIPSGLTGSTGRSGGGSGGGSGSPASDEQLDADRAAIDAAEAELTEARQNRAQAVLTTPVDGTVGMLDLTVGQQVSGNSATVQAVVIAPTQGYQVDVSVGETDVARVAVGNPVTIAPDGGAPSIEGLVSAVGLLPTTSSTGAVTYPVTIALPGVTGPYPAGQGASVAIRLADVAGALTVPTSAVRTEGTSSTVDVLRDNVSSPVQVEVGAVGPIRTEILSGIKPGDQVVIADPTRPLPSADLSRLGGGPPRGGG